MPTHDERDSSVALEYARPSPRRIHALRIGVIVIASICGFFCGLFILASIFPLGLGRPRDPSNRVTCARNMRQIGQALQMWANDHGGHFPNRLEDVLDEDLSPNAFVCPSSDDTPPAGPTTRSIAAALATPGHLSYNYIGKGLTTNAAADVVILYEPLSNHQNQGTNVLFADGHVDFLTTKEIQPLLKQVHAATRPIRLP